MRARPGTKVVTAAGRDRCCSAASRRPARRRATRTGARSCGYLISSSTGRSSHRRDLHRDHHPWRRLAMAVCRSPSIRRSRRRSSTSPGSIPAPAPRLSPKRWWRRSSSRSTASRACSISRRTRPPTEPVLDRRDLRASAPISISRRCRCRTGSRPRSPACRPRCSRSASPSPRASPDIMMVVSLYLDGQVARLAATFPTTPICRSRTR